MPSTLEAPAFVAPAIEQGDAVLYNSGSDPSTWFTAWVNRVGVGSNGAAIEVLIASHDGGGVGGDRGAANCTLIARDNVKHVDDPEGQTEHFQVHVIGDGEGGYWKLPPSEEKARAQIADLQAQIDELRKAAVNSRAPKTNAN